MDANEARAAETAGPVGEDGRVEAFDIAQIMRAIPHRYPFLLVDRIVEVRKNHSCVGIKNVTINENFFQATSPSIR